MQSKDFQHLTKGGSLNGVLYEGSTLKLVREEEEYGGEQFIKGERYKEKRESKGESKTKAAAADAPGY